MNERSIEIIKAYLQNEDAQKRVLRNIQQAHDQATVTIGRVAKLFNFSEYQLRDWQIRGLINPERPAGPTGQRQYSLADLDKLAIIRELIDANFSPGEIPLNLDEIWPSVTNQTIQQLPSLWVKEATDYLTEIKLQPIDTRLEAANKEVFWHYFAYSVIHLSLNLICGDNPHTIAGLILPANKMTFKVIPTTTQLPEIGESLVGWMDLSRSVHLFLTARPSFEYPTDFRILPLQTMEQDVLENELIEDKMLIVIQRKAKSITLSKPLVNVIRRLLAPLFDIRNDWQTYFDATGSVRTYTAANLNDNLISTDNILNRLSDMIVHLGGSCEEVRNWRFCCILMPNDPILPLQQRSLIVRAHSQNSPHKNGTILSPNDAVIGLSIRAFQAGNIVYRAFISEVDSSIAYREKEYPAKSAIAVPVGGEDGQPIAVLYIVSDKTQAFNRDDQRLLRMMARIVEEILLTHNMREQTSENLSEIIEDPEHVDRSFKDYFTENDFSQDIENLLFHIKQEREKKTHEISLSTYKGPQTFIAIDIDNLSSLANKYGDQMMRNLNIGVASRIQGELNSYITKNTDCRIYHIFSDRFYLHLPSVSLTAARDDAERLRNALSETYRIDALRTYIKQPTLPGGMLELSGVKVRLGVTSYDHETLQKFLRLYDSSSNPEAEVRAKIARTLDDILKMGMDLGGNVVMAWDPESGRILRWSPKIYNQD